MKQLFSFIGISKDLPITGYIKMIDVWMIFTISYPFLEIVLHALKEVCKYVIVTLNFGI